MRRRLLGPVSGAMMNFACAFFIVFFVRTPVSLAQAEGPAAAADRFYQEYMSMGVALKPLGDRWFTVRFRSVMNAWDNDALQKPIEANPILPWKNWDSSWRHRLKIEVLEASSDRALVVVTFATDENGRPISRLVHLEKVADIWRVDDVTDPPRKDR
jgi:hypothetical protein